MRRNRVALLMTPDSYPAVVVRSPFTPFASLMSSLQRNEIIQKVKCHAG
jgi:hypothetical protein